MEHVFKVRSSEFIEDDLWTKKAVGEFKNQTPTTLDRRSKRDVCYFDIESSPALFKIIRKKESGRIAFSAECRGNFMFAWALLVQDKTGGKSGQLAFDPLVVVLSKVSSTSGNIRSVKQSLHGVLSTEEPRTTIEMTATTSQRQSKIAALMGGEVFDEVVELMHKRNFVYLCQRNNFQLTREHFVEVEDRLDGDYFEPTVILKHVEGISSDETTNNIEVELVKLFEEPLFRDLMEHIAEQNGMEDSCLEYHMTTDENGEPVEATCVSLQLLKYLALFTRDVSEERRSIIADIKNNKMVLGIFRYFQENDSTQPDIHYPNNIFRLKVDRSSNEKE
jgi:hypothetical protein